MMIHYLVVIPLFLSIHPEANHPSKKDRKEYAKVLNKAISKASILWNQCRINNQNKPGALKNIISEVATEFNLPTEATLTNVFERF